jgi:hypothetical protein
MRLWSFSGLEYVSGDDMDGLGETSLPPNLFALVFTLNGGDTTTFGCTAIIAAMACLTCLNLYLLGVELGAEQRPAMLLMATQLFSPAFLLYSSDMFKDGIVLFFATGAVASAIRLARRLSVTQLVVGALFLWALWYVRFYLVFLVSSTLLVGLAGFRSRSAARPVIAALLLAAAFVIVLTTTDAVDSVTETANATFAKGTGANVLESNASSGSGVVFDDGGSPWGAIGPKLAYMIFSPFPWAGGSLGFQIGKLDTFVWYFILWRGLKAARPMWRRDRVGLLMLLTFIGPMTVAYATTFANVGLSLRQRMVIVMMTSVLAMQSWPRRLLPATTSRAVALRRGPATALQPARGLVRS